MEVNEARTSRVGHGQDAQFTFKCVRKPSRSVISTADLERQDRKGSGVEAEKYEAVAAYVIKFSRLYIPFSKQK